MPAEAMLLKIHERNPELSNHPILIGWSLSYPRTILPSWRQAIGESGFLVFGFSPATFLTPPAAPHKKTLE